MSERRQQLRERQRESIWKWRWLGLRGSTPGFKGSLVIVVIAVILIALYGSGVL